MLTEPSFDADRRTVSGFSTRVDAAGRPLDLGTGSDEADWARAATDLGVPELGVAFISQVHGASVLWATRPGLAGEADAILSREPGLLLAVRTADCVPILVAGEGVVGAIHAGWRGLAAGVIPAAIAELAHDGPLRAVVGPSICMDCYEVGEEVVAGIAAWVPESRFVRRVGPRPHVDPGLAAVAQLEAAGVAEIAHIQVCTACDGRLWSHRLSGLEAGRQAGIVGRLC
jgi:YfiH family protein